MTCVIVRYADGAHSLSLSASVVYAAFLSQAQAADIHSRESSACGP